MKRTILSIICICFNFIVQAQNPSILTIEKTDDTSGSLNLKNSTGFWHLSGPRSYEANNNFSIFWNDSFYKRYFTILDNGNIGIGTASPTQKLEVNGDVIVGNSTRVGSFVNIIGAGTHQNFGLRLGSASNPDSKASILSSTTTGGIFFSVQENSAMLINSTGNVGIGTVSPTSKLQLMNGNNGISFDATDTWEGIGFNRSAKNGQILNTTKSAWQFTARDERFSLEGYNGATNNLLNILKNGNVGIGTKNPDMKLTIKGNIHAEEVKIDLNVPAPDYVFKEDYNLRTIEEVEKFIKENSHLPEIPSAKEFEQNGVMQAEMDMNLLKKIEELTLYTIQQQKEIESLKKENKELKSLSDRLTEIEKLLESEK